MSAWCKLFGHRWGNLCGSYYGVVEDGPRDGIGRVHYTLYIECGRCGKMYVAGRFHSKDSRSKVIDEIKQGLNLEVVIISDDLGNNGYRCEDVDALIRRVEAKP